MMSEGSIHSRSSRTPLLEIKAALSRSCTSLLSRSTSLRRISASDASRGSPLLPGARLITVAAPRMETSGVRNLVRNRADQGVTQRLGLGADPCVVEGVGKVETLQRCSCVGQNGIDPLPNGVSDLPRLRANIDCQYPQIASLPGNGSNEPDATFAIPYDPALV